MVPLRQRSVLPGFRLTLGYTLLYLSLVVLIPLAGVFVKTSSLTWDQFWSAVTAPRVLASYRLSFGASLAAATVNLFFGLLVAWVLVRYQFWGRRLVDALVDLPFALPTAVAGIALTAVYSKNGWIGGCSTPGDQGRLHAPWRLCRADVHRPAVRGAHRAAGAGGPGRGSRGGGRQPGRQPLADLSTGASCPCCSRRC